MYKFQDYVGDDENIRVNFFRMWLRRAERDRWVWAIVSGIGCLLLGWCIWSPK